MKAKLIKAVNIRSSLSTREDATKALHSTERPPDFVATFVQLPVVLPRPTCVPNGGTTGMKPRSSASCRVSLPSYALSISRCSSRFGASRRSSSARPCGASPSERLVPFH